MLNNTATKPLGLEPGQAADFSKVATYYRNIARSNEAAAEGSFGWRREAYAAEAAKYRKAAVTADQLHAYDVANPR